MEIKLSVGLGLFSSSLPAIYFDQINNFEFEFVPREPQNSRRTSLNYNRNSTSNPALLLCFVKFMYVCHAPVYHDDIFRKWTINIILIQREVIYNIYYSYIYIYDEQAMNTMQKTLHFINSSNTQSSQWSETTSEIKKNTSLFKGHLKVYTRLC